MENGVDDKNNEVSNESLNNNLEINTSAESSIVNDLKESNNKEKKESNKGIIGLIFLVVLFGGVVFSLGTIFKVDFGNDLELLPEDEDTDGPHKNGEESVQKPNDSSNNIGDSEEGNKQIKGDGNTTTSIKSGRLLIENGKTEDYFKYNDIVYKVYLGHDPSVPDDDMCSPETLYFNEHKLGPIRCLVSVSIDVYYLGDLVVFVESFYGGSQFHFFNMDGNEIRKLRYVDYNNLKFDIMKLHVSEIPIENDTITFKASAVENGMGNVVTNLQLSNGESMNYCNAEERELYNITDETVVNATFQLKYLGNGKFSDPEMIKGTTFVELNLIEECSNI